MAPPLRLFPVCFVMTEFLTNHREPMFLLYNGVEVMMEYARVRDLREDNDLRQRQLAQYLYVDQRPIPAMNGGNGKYRADCWSISLCCIIPVWIILWALPTSRNPIRGQGTEGSLPVFIYLRQTP